MNTEPPQEISRNKPRWPFLRSRWLRGILVLALLLWGIKAIHHSQQPKYEGKTVEEWFADWQFRISEMPEPHRIEVCANLGTNAVWYLWGEYCRKDSVGTAWVMGKKHRIFGSGYQFATSHEEQRHLKAISTLHLLGGQCEPLIPEIMNRMKSPNLDEAAGMAYFLGQIRRQPEIVVPAIHLSLLSTNWNIGQRMNHLSALENFGDQAKSVLLELRSRLANPVYTNSGENLYLAKAILLINGPGPELCVFTNKLVPGDINKSISSLTFLERVGTNGISAVPVLSEFLKTLTNESDIWIVTNAIHKIDPEGIYHKP